MIPALRNAEFVRYGVMHRNTFINSPELLDAKYMLKNSKNIYFAGQMTGVEGYIESASSGFVAGLNLAMTLLGRDEIIFPDSTATGALSHYVSNPGTKNFQPMNVNFGIMEPLGMKIRKKQEKNLKLSEKALEKIEEMKV